MTSQPIETEVIIDIMGYHSSEFVTQQSEILSFIFFFFFFNQGQTVEVTVLCFPDLKPGLLTLFFSEQQI